MTDYVYRIAFAAPVAHYEACQRVANALGREGDVFGIDLAPEGSTTVTHKAGTAQETQAFMDAVAQVDPPEISLGPVTDEDWTTVKAHLTVEAAADGNATGMTVFDRMCDKLGVVRAPYAGIV